MNSSVLRLVLTAICGLSSLASFCQAKPDATVITWIEDKPGPTMQEHRIFPSVPDSVWAELDLTAGVPSSISCILMETEGKHILFDAGLGAPVSQLLPKLAEAGIKPENLELIYLSHLHGDHIGGLLNNGKAVFPNAQIHINKVELDAWLAMPENRNAQVRSMVSAYKNQIHTFTAGDTLEGGVITIAAYGHTPGHTVFQKGDILIIADLLHGAALQLQHPEYCAFFDMDQKAAIESRKRILKYASDNGLTMYGMHLPNPGAIKATR